VPFMLLKDFKNQQSERSAWLLYWFVV
jgi:hypothetical protein